MHELPVTQGILERVLEHAAKANASRVTAIHLVIGERSGISPECIEFYWDAISRGTLAHGATIHVRRLPFEMTCLDCARAFHPTQVTLGYQCPACNGMNVRTTHGEECGVEAIDIRDEGDHAHSPTDPA